MQSSKSGGMGSAMTGNALNSALGGEAADKLLVKITAVLASLFMILAIGLNVLDTPGSVSINSSPDNSILDRNKLKSTNDIIQVPSSTDTKESETDEQ